MMLSTALANFFSFGVKVKVGVVFRDGEGRRETI